MLVSRLARPDQTRAVLWRQFDNCNNVRAWRMRVMGTPTPGKRQKAATMASLVILSINQSAPGPPPPPRHPRCPALRAAGPALSCPSGW